MDGLEVVGGPERYILSFFDGSTSIFKQRNETDQWHCPASPSRWTAYPVRLIRDTGLVAQPWSNWPASLVFWSIQPPK